MTTNSEIVSQKYLDDMNYSSVSVTPQNQQAVYEQEITASKCLLSSPLPIEMSNSNNNTRPSLTLSSTLFQPTNIEFKN